MPYLITGFDKGTKKTVKIVSKASTEALARKSADALGIEIESIVEESLAVHSNRPKPNADDNGTGDEFSPEVSPRTKTWTSIPEYHGLLIASGVLKVSAVIGGVVGVICLIISVFLSGASMAIPVSLLIIIGSAVEFGLAEAMVAIRDIAPIASIKMLALRLR